MKILIGQWLRWSPLILIAFAAGFLGLRAARHTAWYQNRLYAQLTNGDMDERFSAAVELTTLGAQELLLKGLQHDEAPVHDLSRRGLEHLWFTQCGDEAFALAQEAHAAIETNDLPRALKVCQQMVERFPRYAEGWNRRAAVYWELGEYEKSLSDCEHALALNPKHYGAWQGLGACQIKLGHTAEACRSLRAAKKICPHDEATQRALEKCEELLREFTPPGKNKRNWDAA